jgi:hypothetical protein
VVVELSTLGHATEPAEGSPETRHNELRNPEVQEEWLARRNDEAHARRLIAQLERLGHTVVLDPVA